MRQHKICVVTGSRAEYGLLYPVIKRLDAEQDMELSLVVTGSHLDAAFGNTIQEIHGDGFSVAATIPVPTEISSRCDMAKSAGAALSAFADYFAAHRPDMLVILGDRYEIFAVATAAALQGIPIAHLHGGETTEGAVDEFLRHSITKMSWLHFTSCEEYRNRVIQLGEAPERVYNVGATSVENSRKLELLSETELREQLSLGADPYCVVTFHPVTLDESPAKEQVYELIHAMEEFPQMRFVITKSNADAGGVEINRIWDEEGAKHPNWTVTASLGMRRYLSALKYARMMIGNSSSGITEGPAMQLPTVNIGNRQKGRMMADSIVNCPVEQSAIADTIRLCDGEAMQQRAKAVKNPYGDGSTSQKIEEILRKELLSGLNNTQKSFYNLSALPSADI